MKEEENPLLKVSLSLSLPLSPSLSLSLSLSLPLSLTHTIIKGKKKRTDAAKIRSSLAAGHAQEVKEGYLL